MVHSWRKRTMCLLCFKVCEGYSTYDHISVQTIICDRPHGVRLFNHDESLLDLTAVWLKSSNSIVETSSE